MSDKDDDFIPTREQALALRPRLDDPTHLTNGNPHPTYVSEWLLLPDAERHPLHTLLFRDECLERVSNDQGYFDKKKCVQILGPSGPKMFLRDGPLPTKGKIPLLAQFVDVSSDELIAVVSQERAMREKYQRMLERCCWLPCKLLTYEQQIAGVPCPGCGRPWIATDACRDNSDEDQWNEAHSDCHAGRHGFEGGPRHCLRCCGFPSLNPEILRRVSEIIEASRKEQEAEAARDPLVLRQQAERRASGRAKRIKSLEAELAKLRAEENQAPNEH